MLPDPVLPEKPNFDGWTCPMPLRDHPTIVMGHGGGGQMSGELIEHLFLPAFGPAADAGMGDSALLDVGNVRLAFSTDSFVVKPLVFPGIWKTGMIDNSVLCCSLLHIPSSIAH